MSKSAIQYADYAWNPTTGCLPGLPCWDRCWARAMARRFHPGGAFAPREHPEVLDRPLRTRKPGVVAVSFGGDLFAAGISMGFTREVFAAMIAAPQHTFLVLTKRPERMKWLRLATPIPNVLLGTSVSTQADADERISHLMGLAAKGWRTWVSVEPMLGALDMDPARCPSGCTERLGAGIHIDADGMPCCDECCDEASGAGWLDPDGLSWIVCGAESGPGARPVALNSVRSLRDQCAEAGLPFFYKQGPSCDEMTPLAPMGAWQREVQVGHKATLLPILDGRTHAAMPEVPA